MKLLLIYSCLSILSISACHKKAHHQENLGHIQLADPATQTKINLATTAFDIYTILGTPDSIYNEIRPPYLLPFEHWYYSFISGNQRILLEVVIHNSEVWSRQWQGL